MVQVCTKCARANPEDASYCYFDGFVLGNGARNGGPLAIGAQAFQQPFVFPTGRQCRNFDELAMACQEDWPTARDLLGKGYLEGFFSGLGRLDLVRAAKEANKFPDHDRGLDQLLGKLPSDVVAAPRLSVETREVNLGVLKVGETREFDLHLENQGMRLLYGSVSCAEAKHVWLSLGDTPGTTEKHFQFGHDHLIKVKVCGDRLRASSKPLVAKLDVESNGGSASITVRAEVHVKPFSGGVLSGAKSPRQLAEKAKLHPKEAPAYFERGEVEAWYKTNGWTYPVQGPAAAGLQAIQQFFEALGLVKPPVVQISTREITLAGKPGDKLACEIKVESQERKPVYAHAVSDQPWLQPDKATFHKATATIKVAIPAVPNQPGRTLSAKLTVQSNGNQRFEVPVSLAVQGNAFDFNGTAPKPEPTPAAQARTPEESEAVLAAALGHNPAPPPVPVLAPAAPEQTFAAMLSPEPAPGARTASRRRRPSTATPLWMHALPAVLLALAVLLVVIFDRKGSTSPVDHFQPTGEELLTLQFDPERQGSFGLEMKNVPDPTNQDRKKRLTYDPRGHGDNIIVKLEDKEYFFHFPSPNTSNTYKLEGKHGRENIKVFKEANIEVTQHVDLVHGTSGNLDTCLVYFTIANLDSKSDPKVGLRVLMDTYIGANDGVPFTIPGEKGFLDTMKEFREKNMPDYIEAIEKPDTPNDLGTIVRMGLRNLQIPGFTLEPLERMRICKYPGSQTKWDWDMEPMNANPKLKDSCVALYWPYLKMNPGEKRTMGYTYGLSELSTDVGDSLMALSAPPLIRPNAEFRITAYVWKARKGQKITLELPDGLQLADKETIDKTVEEDGNRVQVSWKVKAGDLGEYNVTAKMGPAISKPLKVKVRDSIF